MNVGIVGGGAIGGALGHHLHKQNHTVRIWDKDPTRANVVTLSDIVCQSEVVILAVPSLALPELANKLLYLDCPNFPLILSVAKGMLGGMTVPHYLHQTLLPRTYNIGVWYGPMLANEINQNRHAFGVISSYNSVGREMCVRLAGPKLLIEWYDEPDGIAWAGVLKNCYAFALGLSDGLNLGRNYSGAIATQAVREMVTWLKLKRLRSEAALAWAGIGDLIATGTSVDSYNYRTGHAIGREDQGIKESKCEGLHSLIQLSESVNLEPVPLLKLLSEIATEQQRPQQIGSYFESRY